MAPPKRTKKPPNASTPSNPKHSIHVASSNPKHSSHVADPNPVPVFADQSRSRLMTLPKELRNNIYKLVFCDNIDHVHEPTRYSFFDGSVMADTPTRVRLDQTSPPSKGPILACRELYSEMKGMHAAAYLAYWSNNRFVFDGTQPNRDSALPADRDIKHIQHLCLLVRCLKDYYLHLVFEEGKWGAWPLPKDGEILESHWLGFTIYEAKLKGAVNRYVDSVVTSGNPLDPSTGHGFTRNLLRDLSDDGGLAWACDDWQGLLK